jgi:hypothetical protein
MHAPGPADENKRMADRAIPMPLPASRTRTGPSWPVLGFGLLIATLVLFSQRDRFASGRNDFIQLWVGANLSGTPQLYDFEANNALQKKTIGVTLDNVSPHSRPPFYSFLLKPLGLLPYHAAFVIFELLSLAALAGYVWMNLARLPELAVLTCFSLPAIANLANGQDVAFCVFIAGAALMLFSRQRDFEGGMLLTLCAIKFHLFLLVPLIPLIHRRWRILAGGAVGLAGLMGLSFLAQGPGWIPVYLGVLRNPNLTPGAEFMPNLHGLLSVLGYRSFPVEAAACVAVAALVAWIAWKEKDFEVAFGYALLGGLLVSFHAYLQDGLILLPVLVAVLTKVTVPAVRHLMLLASLPPVHLMLLGGAPYSVACPLLLVAILLAAAIFRAPNPA